MTKIITKSMEIEVLVLQQFLTKANSAADSVWCTNGMLRFRNIFFLSSILNANQNLRIAGKCPIGWVKRVEFSFMGVKELYQKLIY